MAHILVIEDSRDIRTLVSNILTRAGHEVCEAPDGHAGVEAYREAPTDLVITDIFMPKKAGIETITDLQEIDEDVKIVAMTAHGTEEQYDFLRVARAQGAVQTIEKPFSAADLIRVVSEALDDHQ